MREREEQQPQLVDHIFVVDSEIVFESSDRNILLELTLHHLFSLVGQLLAVLHGHALDDRLLEHAEARNGLGRIEHRRILWDIVRLRRSRGIEIRIDCLWLLLLVLRMIRGRKLGCGIECGRLEVCVRIRTGAGTKRWLWRRKRISHVWVGCHWGAHCVHIANSLDLSSRTS